MFDKRLMKMCPESRKYIAGNVLLQWLELAMNAVMILMRFWQAVLKSAGFVSVKTDHHRNKSWITVLAKK